MQPLFEEIFDLVLQSTTPIVALHNGVVDQVVNHSIPLPELAARLKAREQRLRASAIFQRLGGGGVNFALSASAIGHPNVVFAGFLDEQAFVLLQQIKDRYGLDLNCIRQPSEPRTNVVFEPLGIVGKHAGHGNFLFGVKSSEYDFGKLLPVLKSMNLPPSGWVASCSFNPAISLPVLGLTQNYILDAGYGSDRFGKKYATKLVEDLKVKKDILKTVILAANEAEVLNIAAEFGGNFKSRFDAAKFIVDKIFEQTGVAVNMLLHTSKYSTFVSPGQSGCWVVPAYKLDVEEIVRLTNAGDTMFGAFAAAYDATKDPKASILFSHAAVACRLSKDELPNRVFLDEFVASHKLRQTKVSGAKVEVPISVNRIRV